MPGWSKDVRAESKGLREYSGVTIRGGRFWLGPGLALALALCACASVAEPSPRETSIDTMLNDLHQTQSLVEAQIIQRQIRKIWASSGVTMVDELIIRAAIALENRNIEAALRYGNEAVRLAPRFTEGYLIRAMIMADREQYLKAANDLKAVLALEPRHFVAWEALGQIMMDTMRYDLAIRAFNQALDLNPHLTFAQRQRAKARILVKGVAI